MTENFVVEHKCRKINSDVTKTFQFNRHIGCKLVNLHTMASNF